MPQGVRAETLVRVEAPRNLPGPVLDAIAACVSTRGYDPGMEVVRHLDNSRDLCIILTGSVRVSLISATGRALTYQILESGEMFGEVAAVDGLPRTATVLAEEYAVIARIAPAALDELIEESSEFARVIIDRLARSNRRLVQRLFEYHTYNVKGRVYCELLRLTADQPDVTLTITDRDMATRVGTTRPNVNRIHSDLRRRALIEKSKDRLKVLDRRRIEELLKQCEFSS